MHSENDPTSDNPFRSANGGDPPTSHAPAADKPRAPACASTAPTKRIPDANPTLAYVETDRFCDSCGYNLRTQPVSRDDRTRILIIRCPECGRFHAATDAATIGRLWLQRLASGALFAWIVLAVAAYIGACVAMGGMTFGTLDELTTWQFAPVPPGGNTGGFTRSGTLVVRRHPPYYEMFMVAVTAASILLAACAGALVSVVCHHWPRWAYLALMLTTPLIVGVFVQFIWTSGYPYLSDWSIQYVGYYAVAQMLGGVAGVSFGRVLARLVARIVLPPRPRSLLAFLWLADDLPVPAAGRADATSPDRRP